ncbi:MAG: hypothetical protein DRO16_03220 [Thermoprotei archaeon]|nr:MAG: hypothetical protein DRO16_03220 [Thermoprotei archaeon]
MRILSYAVILTVILIAVIGTITYSQINVQKNHSLLLLINNTRSIESDENVIFYFYIYGDHECPHCRAMKDFLTKTYGSEHVFFCDLRSNKTCVDRLGKLYSLTHQEFLLYVPQTYIVYNCTVSALVIGEARDKAFLESLFRTNTDNKIPVYMGEEHIANIVVKDQKEFLREYVNYNNICFRNISTTTTTPSNNSVIEVIKNYSLTQVLPSLIFLALIDSVNPCTITLYFSYLLTLLSAKKKIIGPAIVFLIVIFIGYYMIAFGFKLLSQFIPSTILLGIAIVVGLYNIIDAGRNYSKGIKCTWCEKIGVFDKVLKSPYIAALTLSLISVTVLLPCTSGPLLVFITMIKDYPLYLTLPLLVIYNIIFISPLLIIFIASYMLGKQEKIANYLMNHAQVIEFIAGILIILIAFYLLL